MVVVGRGGGGGGGGGRKGWKTRVNDGLVDDAPLLRRSLSLLVVVVVVERTCEGEVNFEVGR